MALVNLEQETILATLQDKFNMYIENDWLVSIHISTPHMEAHHCIRPEIALANNNELNLSSGHFDIVIHLGDVINFDIQIETEESFCVIADDIEIYMDFSQQ